MAGGPCAGWGSAQHHPDRVGAGRVADGQARIVGADRARAHHDGAALGPQAVGVGASGAAGDPLGGICLGLAVRPSSEAPELSTTHGRPVVRCFRYGASWLRTDRRAGPRRPGSPHLAACRCRDRPPGVPGSTSATTTREMPASISVSVQGPARRVRAHGSSVTQAVAPRAASPAASSATTSAWRPPGGSAALSEAGWSWAASTTNPPTGWARSGCARKRRGPWPAAWLRCRPRHLPLVTSTRRAGGAHPRSSGLSPARPWILTESAQIRGSGFVGCTAGRDLHPAPRGRRLSVFSCRSPPYDRGPGRGQPRPLRSRPPRRRPPGHPSRAPTGWGSAAQGGDPPPSSGWVGGRDGAGVGGAVRVSAGGGRPAGPGRGTTSTTASRHSTAPLGEPGTFSTRALPRRRCHETGGRAG